MISFSSPSVHVYMPSRYSMFTDDFSSSLKSFSYLQTNYLPLSTTSPGSGCQFDIECHLYTLYLAVLRRKQRRGVDELYPHWALSDGKNNILTHSTWRSIGECFLRPGMWWKSTQVEDSSSGESGSFHLGYTLGSLKWKEVVASRGFGGEIN